MSTRALIIVKDEYGDKLGFYRHSDGYPEGVMPLIQKYVDMVRSGQLRNNVVQSAGWLIELGRQELVDMYKDMGESGVPAYYKWKIGTIEPHVITNPKKQSDLEYCYTINLSNCTVQAKEL